MATKLLRILLSTILLIVIVVGIVAYSLMSSCNNGDEEIIIEVRSVTSIDDIRQILHGGMGFRLACVLFRYDKTKTGRYSIPPGMSWLQCVRMLHNHSQQPLQLVLKSVRTTNQLAAFLGERLMIDSASFATAFHSVAYLDSIGYTEQTLPALFIPNTYEVWWDTTLPHFMERMQHESNVFWQGERTSLATHLGLTPTEVATLASILDEETANDAEKPMIAGMYLNRLRIGMPLQADPTIKFAVGDFSLKRILHAHLTVDSPYNTYTNTGLPPGPIRIASIAAIDAVLHAVEHPYLYMCANSDFSGTHVFARTYAQHLRNARLYQKALNQRGIH